MAAAPAHALPPSRLGGAFSIDSAGVDFAPIDRLLVDRPGFDAALVD
jgi:hypothetical protein